MSENPAVTVNPTSLGDRIFALDVIRGIALNGILIMNILGFAFHINAYGNPHYGGGTDELNMMFFKIQDVLFEGSMRGLFSLLFGVSMVLFMDRFNKKNLGVGAAYIYSRRLLWLLIFGMIHGYILLWWGEILFFYAVGGFLMFGMLNMSPKKIIIISASLFMIGTYLNYYKYDQLTIKKDRYEKYIEMTGVHADSTVADSVVKKMPKYIVNGFNEYKGILKSAKYDTTKFKEYISLRKDSTYTAVVREQKGMIENIEMGGTYHGVPWDILSMMLLGVFLYKTNIVTGEKKYGLYVTMAVVGYSVGLAINFYEYGLKSADWFNVLENTKANITYEIGRICITMAHLGVILMFVKSRMLMFIQRGLAAVGKMALSNYIMHTIICMIFFMGFGFNYFNEMERYQVYYVVIAVWVFEFFFSLIWLKYFKYGPLEWGWRRLTYGKIEGMKQE